MHDSLGRRTRQLGPARRARTSVRLMLPAALGTLLSFVARNYPRALVWGAYDPISRWE